jgi:hypothetical protein
MIEYVIAKEQPNSLITKSVQIVLRETLSDVRFAEIVRPQDESDSTPFIDANLQAIWDAAQPVTPDVWMVYDQAQYSNYYFQIMAAIELARMGLGTQDAIIAAGLNGIAAAPEKATEFADWRRLARVEDADLTTEDKKAMLILIMMQWANAGMLVGALSKR